MTTTYAVIGDVHGCLSALVRLVTRLPCDAHLVFVGDLIDKGPDSAGVLDYILALRQRRAVVVVQGNHEYSHLRYDVQRENSESIYRQQTAAVFNTFSPAHIEFLRSGLAPRFAFGPWLVVHAGIPPALQTWEPTNAKERRYVQQTMFIRRVDEDNEPLTTLDSSGRSWAAVYDGRFGHVIFGHEVQPEPMFWPHATAIDTGCYQGGPLTAMIVQDDSARNVRFVQEYQ